MSMAAAQSGATQEQFLQQVLLQQEAMLEEQRKQLEVQQKQLEVQEK